MPITLCRGPLSKTKWNNAIFCAPDNDVPWAASGLSVVPRLSAIRDGKHTLVYLEAHRAHDDIWNILNSLECNVIVQGDPLALRPRGCNIFAEKLLTVPDFPWFTPALDYFPTLRECVENCDGDWRIIAPDKTSAHAACTALRGAQNCVHTGDLVFDRKNKKLARVFQPDKVLVGSDCPATTVRLDDGRLVSATQLFSFLVQTVSNFGSGECDVLVLLPNMSESFGSMALRRVRHKAIGLGWHPSVYI